MQLLSVNNLYRQEVGATEEFDISESGHQFNFPEEIEVSNVSGKATFIKLEDSIIANGELTAEVVLICDRCLDNFDKTIKFSFEREFVIDRKSQSEEGLYVDKRGNIDLSSAIHDELLLAIPTQNFCKEACLGICLGCGQNLNNEK